MFVDLFVAFCHHTHARIIFIATASHGNFSKINAAKGKIFVFAAISLNTKKEEKEKEKRREKERRKGERNEKRIQFLVL